MRSREEQILSAAEELFHERGFSGVGVAEIGKRAGIAPSAIYRYFDSKDEILGALFERAADVLLHQVDQPADDPLEDLRNLTAAHLRFAEEHYKLAAIWALDVRSLTGTHLRSFRRREHAYADRWLHTLATCVPDRSREELTIVLRGIWALLMSGSVNATRSQRDTGQVLVELAMGALERLVPAEGHLQRAGIIDQ